MCYVIKCLPYTSFHAQNASSPPKISYLQTKSTTMTKRKSEEENAAVSAKRRVPFTMPKDVATNAVYETTSMHPNLAVADANLQNIVMRETHQARRCYECRLRFATRYGD